MRGSVPETPGRAAEWSSSAETARARALREELLEAVSIRDDWVAVRLTLATTLEVRSGHETNETNETSETDATGSRQVSSRGRDAGPPRQERRLAAAQALIGPRRDRPTWSRIAPIAGGASSWPGEWTRAAARAVEGWSGDRASLLEAERLPRVPVVLDVFALSDVLRAEARRWMTSSREGGSVASATVTIEDPGFFFPAVGGDRDGLGDPVRASTIVREGTLAEHPVDRTDGGPRPGFAIRGSWRGAIRPGFRSLSLTVPPAEPPPAAVHVTRVQLLSGLVFASGHLSENGRTTGRFGPLRVPSPRWWLAHIVGAIGPAVPDATGLPVRVPPVLIDRPLPCGRG